jgi:hypothetical protein
MLAALCLAMVFAISLSSYMALCYVSLAMSTRSVMSSHSIELAEAGIEQALYEQNNDNGNWSGDGWTVTNGTPIATESSITITMTMTANGLAPTSSNPTPLNLGNGATGLVNITVITNTSSGIVAEIQSQGQMVLPSGFASNGAALTNITRTLTYYAPSVIPIPYTPSAPLFVNAVAAISGNVQFSSGGTIDSYDSISNSGTPQTYSPTVAGWSAVVASQNVATSSATVLLNDAVLNGYAVGYNYPSPGSTNWLSYGSAGMIVGKSPSVYIDSSRILTTPVPFQPVFKENLPNPNQAPLSTIAASTTLGNASGAVYTTTGISLGSGNVVTITGPTVIIDSGALQMTGSAQIILSQGASLALFVEGGSVGINCTGTGGIVPAAAVTVPLAKNFALLSTNNPTTTNTVTIAQQVPWYGVVYFPYRKVTIGTSGTTAPIYGSIVGASVTFTSSPTIHYDVALRRPDSTYGDVAFDYLWAPVTVGNLIASTP